jgi:glycosyltransferase involved in cell wall biosynthesis
MRLSIVIPAFNEANYLAATIGALKSALEANQDRIEFSEIIVCDNNSTDATSQVARDLGAKVVFESHNQISRARNTGAKAASGDWLLFVDADTIVSAITLGELAESVATGRIVGGGGALRMDTSHLATRMLTFILVKAFRLLKWAGGAFIFCRADAFQAIGGFDENVYAGEEVFFCRKLKRQGRAMGLGFAFLHKDPVMTSSRKLKTHGLGSFLKIVFRGMFRPLSTVRSREHLGYFYDGKR